MQTTQLPGFRYPVYDAQKTFRALLDAIARPGTLYPIPAKLQPPAGLTPACALASLTLLDLETRVWLPPDWPAEVEAWLRFHTGCSFVAETKSADFALLNANQVQLNAFSRGTTTDPETSATLLIQVADFSSGPKVELRGPGIQTREEIRPAISAQFWQQWQRYQDYPLGVDVFLFTADGVLGLPRSVNVELAQEVR